MPAGSTDSQMELISPPGRCQMTKEIYGPCSNKPVPCLLYLRDIMLPVVSYTPNQQSVVEDSLRHVYRSSKHHVALVPLLFLAKKEMALDMSVSKRRSRVTLT